MMPLSAAEALVLAALLDVHGPPHLIALADRLTDHARTHPTSPTEEATDG